MDGNDANGNADDNGRGGDNDVPGLVDLDGDDTPLAGGDDVAGGSGVPAWIWALVIAGILALTGLIFALARRRGSDEEEAEEGGGGDE